MATPKDYSSRISYSSQASGEYYIYVDGKFWCSSDNYRELQEDLKDVESYLEELDKKNNKESTN